MYKLILLIMIFSQTPEHYTASGILQETNRLELLGSGEDTDHTLPHRDLDLALFGPLASQIHFHIFHLSETMTAHPPSWRGN